LSWLDARIIRKTALIPAALEKHDDDLEAINLEEEEFKKIDEDMQIETNERENVEPMEQDLKQTDNDEIVKEGEAGKSSEQGTVQQQEHGDVEGGGIFLIF
jgi:hypothetical protein